MINEEFMIKQTSKLSLRSLGSRDFTFLTRKLAKSDVHIPALLRFWQNKLIGRDRNHGPRQK